MQKYILLVLPLFLTSCVSMIGENTVRPDGAIVYNAHMDMSGLADMTDSPSSAEDAKMCTGFQEKIKDVQIFTDMSCTETGDYKADIKSTLPQKYNPALYVGSGVIAYDPAIMKQSREDVFGDSLSVKDQKEIKESGMKLEATWKFPYPIVTTPRGSTASGNTIAINFLTPSVMRAPSLLIVARADGKKPTAKELSAYRMQIRKQMQKAKKSEIWDQIQKDGMPF